MGLFRGIINMKRALARYNDEMMRGAASASASMARRADVVNRTEADMERRGPGGWEIVKVGLVESSNLYFEARKMFDKYVTDPRTREEILGDIGIDSDFEQRCRDYIRKSGEEYSARTRRN